MTAPVFGFTFRREALEPAPPSNAIMSVVGICSPFTKAADAVQGDFDAAFPLDTPVLINSTDSKAALIDPTCSVGDQLAVGLVPAQRARDPRARHRG